MSVGWKSGRADWTLQENRLAALLRRLRSERVPLLDLTVSNPTRTGSWHDQAALAELLAAAAGARYEPAPLGLVSAREALAASLSSDEDPISPDDLILCASTSEAYSWLFKLCGNPGEEVLTPVPSYPLLDAICSLESLSLCTIPMQRVDRSWRVEPAELLEAASNSACALAVVHPNNPTGHALGSSEMDDLLGFCTRRDLPLISDEVFIDYRLSDRLTEGSLAGRAEGVIFSLGGLSKMLALPHWKLGWIRLGGDPSLRRRTRDALEWIADTFLSVNTPVQVALPGLLSMKESIQQPIRERLRTNLARADEVLGQLPSVEVDRPDGGWSLLIRIPQIESDDAFVTRLLMEEQVVVQPGYFYDVPWDSIVLSLLTPEDDFAEGVVRIATALRRVLSSLDDVVVDSGGGADGESTRWC